MERPSETYRVSFQNKFDALVHLVGFTIEAKYPVCLNAFERKLPCRCYILQPSLEYYYQFYKSFSVFKITGFRVVNF